MNKWILLLIFMPTVLQAAVLNLADSPLFLGTKVDPNIFFELDDSGSMDWEILAPTHWHACAYDPNITGSFSSATNCGFQTSNGLIRSYGSSQFRYFDYIFHTADNLYSDSCNDPDSNSIESCPSAGTADWRVYSPDLNFLYYDPSVTYTPWPGPCLLNNTACANANFSAVRSNPREGSAGYTIIRTLAGSLYQVWFDDKGYKLSDGRPLRASAMNAINTPNSEVDLWDNHIKVVINSTTVQVYKTTYVPTTSSLGETTTLLGTLSNPLACYNVLGPKANVKAVLDGTSAFNAIGGSGCRTIIQAQNNFANWYQYQRRRSLAAKAAISIVLSQSPNNRYGLSVINNPNTLFVEMPNSGVTNYTAQNQNILVQLYSYAWSALGTPLRTGLETVGKYYNHALAGKADPIIFSCEQNFTVLLTDGSWNGNDPNNTVGDSDKDGVSKTLADVARYYYLKDLSALPDQVVPNAFDPATYQHMVTFTVGFGLSGNLVDTDGDGWPNPVLSENGNWGNPYNSDSEKIDDLWHAAFDSKGTYISAKTPQAITTSISNALSHIASRVSSATMAAQNSTTLQTNAFVYQARFDSATWLGELIAYPISLVGNVSNTPTWNANCILSGGDCVFPILAASNNPGKNPNQRVIITRDWSNGGTQGIAFRWPTSYISLKNNGVLPTRVASFLASAPYSANTIVPSEITANQAYGDALLSYLRGDRSQEASNNGNYLFRSRKGILGDIVDSDPLYVSSPARFYPDTLEAQPYSAFRTAQSSRPPMIFAGANDGMLHGFLATTGEEILAYIPGMREIYAHLPSLSKITYAHTNFVDGSANENDVFINGAWRTMLVSGLRNGGQGIFALDITNPANFNQNNANKILMWEFSDENDPDLGFVYGTIPIVKVRTSGGSKWAAIVGNGYNNSIADGFSSTTGQAALFILFIEQGVNGAWTSNGSYIKIPVGPSDPNNPNGLGTPYPVDIDSDFVTDYVYSGDLKGNIWKFDLRDISPTNWKQNTTLLFTAYQTTPGDQPITAPVVVSPHPTGLQNGIMIYFGTGKYLETSDNTSVNQATQSFYGIWDKLNGSVPAKSALLAQHIVLDTTQSFDTNNDGTLDTSFALRQVSDNSINWKMPVNAGDPPQHSGWYINLKADNLTTNQGERQITKPILRNNSVIFTTLIPSTSPCDFGGTSWLMELRAENGGQVPSSPFDLNHDGVFDAKDTINLGSLGYAIPSGKQSKVGISSTPAVFLSGDKSTEYKISNGATGLETTIENPANGPQGRQTWRQITP